MNPPRPAAAPRLRAAAQALALLLGYLLAARLGQMLPLAGTHLAMVWLPSGIAVAVLLRWGDRMLPVLALAVLLEHAARPAMASATLWFVLGNTLAPWCSAALLRRLGFRGDFAAPSELPRFLAGILTGMALAPLLGAAALGAAGIVDPARLPGVFVRWWAADVVGVLLAAPPLLTFTRQAWRGRRSGAGPLEGLLPVALTLLVGAAVFLVPQASLGEHAWIQETLMFVPFVPLAWLALRSGHVYTPAAAVVLLALVAAWGTAHGLGPIGGPHLPMAALSELWGYLASLSLIALVLGSTAAEASQAARNLGDYYERTADAIVLASAAGRIEAANPAAQALFGLPEGELRRRGLADLMAGDDPRLQAALQAPDADAQHSGVATAVRGDGSRFKAEFSARSYRQAGGPARAFVLLRDVSAREQATQALAREARLHRLLFEQAGDCIVVLDRAARPVAFNASFAATLGHGAERLRTLRGSDWDLSLADAGPPWGLGAAQPRDPGTRRETQWRCADGRLLAMELRVDVVDWDGQPACFCVARDITALKQARARQDEGERLAGIGAWHVDLDSGATDCTPGLLAILGLPAQQVPTLPGMLALLLGPGDTAEALAGLEQRLARAEAVQGEVQAQHADGHALWIEYRVVADGADRRRLTAVLQDVSARRAAQAELEEHRQQLEHRVIERTQALAVANAELQRARDAAESANRAKSSFLANMSHEIRTPLNAILGLAHLLSRQATDPQTLRHLHKVEEAGTRLLALVDGVLDLSKIEAGALQLECAPFSLQEVVAQTLSLLEDRAQAKGLHLRSRLAPQLPPWLLGDALRLGQILSNLVANAIKFSEHGQIELHAELLHEDAQGVQLRLEVLDQGMGLSAAEQARIFAPFAQADESITRRFGGSGLGLSIVRRLATLMDGEAGVRSRAPQGSCFWVTLRLARAAGPAQPTAPEPALPAAPLAEPARGLRVLLVEDDAVNREVALDRLAYAGLVVDTAHDGQEAVQRVRETDYALVLMDMQMPVMDGLQATRAIRALPGRGQVPIVAMTANAFAEDRQACLDAGMNEHLSKPIDPARLHAALQRWLALPQGADPSAPLPVAPPWDEARLRAAGLDLDQGQRAVGGSAAAYRRILALFLRHHAGDAQQLRPLLDTGDGAAADRLLHQLKGAAATLGATRVLQATLALTAQLRAGEPQACSAALPALEEALDAVCGALRLEQLAPPAAAAGGAHPGDARRSARALQELRRLLQQDDARTPLFWEGNAAALREALGAAADGVDAAVRRFDFPLALRLLEGAAADAPAA